MSIEFSDLSALYRAAEHQEQPTRADKRAVRTAIHSAAIASSALHATTASAKLLSIVPGGAKVLTIGQIVVYSGVGAAPTLPGRVPPAFPSAQPAPPVGEPSAPVGQR